MKINNSFTVDLPPVEAWAVLMDVEGIIPCVPGAELVEVVDERAYKGKVSVRLGPVALSFLGTVIFEQVDEAAHRATLRAQGQDQKGRGGANATVTFRLKPMNGGSGCRVDIDTNLMLSGSIAQYGRAQGVISAVSEDIISQFSGCLAKRLHGRSAMAADAAGAQASARADSPARPPDAAKPLSVFGLMFRILRNATSDLFAWITGRR